MINVVQFQRKAGAGMFSVERLFSEVRAALPAEINLHLWVNRHMSKGILPRLLDAIGAWREQGAVNHVLGDVHYLAWFLPRRRTIITVLDCVSLERLTGIRRWLLWVFWYWLPLRNAARVTVISEFGRQALSRWVRYPAERIQVIPPPLPAEFQRVDAAQNDGVWRLLQIGTTQNKNLLRVIESLHGLSVILVIIGDLGESERLALRDAGVSFENHVNLDGNQLLEQYRRAHIVVFASTYEGFGMPIIEAQAVGRPVVTSNVCSMPEAAGGAACLVNPYDVEDIRRGICRLMSDEVYRVGLVERGYENAERYAPERIAAQYADLYREVDSAGRPQHENV